MLFRSIVDLVGRLRRAGIQVSDRRAVKMQRLVAASTLLCGRSIACLSDLWVFRYIWDKLEQREALATIVDEMLKAKAPDAADHPRAHHADAPDPEAIARDLETIATKLESKDLTVSERAMLKDRVSLLSARCQWVKGDEQRAFLVKRIEALWKTVEQGAAKPGGRT